MVGLDAAGSAAAPAEAGSMLKEAPAGLRIPSMTLRRMVRLHLESMSMQL